MNVTEVLKKALDVECERLQGADLNEKSKSINEAIANLSSSFENLKTPGRAMPDYSSDATRFGYLYKYTTCHANLVYQAIRSSQELSNIFNTKGWVDISCIGGGPGTDFLGIMKYCTSQGLSPKLKFFILDREPSWGDTWAEVEKYTDDYDGRISTQFQMLDILESETWTRQIKYRSSKLFSFVYIFSELYGTNYAMEEYFSDLVESAGAGSMFLYIDNNSEVFNGMIEDVANNIGLTCLMESAGLENIDVGEEKKVLEPYLSGLSHRPKLRTNVTMKLYRKDIL